MTAEENILEQFDVLLKTGYIARSTCSGSFLQKIKPLLDAGVIVEKRSGAGRRLVVCDFDSLLQFKNHHFPQATLPEGLSSRVEGVARFRGSKTLKNNTPEIVTIRAWTEGALCKNNTPIDVVSLTKQHGVFSFLAGQSNAYTLHGVCALVENPAVFTQFEKLALSFDLALFGRGKISNRLLDWLAVMNSDFKLVHFPDYDPVGLMDFERLRTALGQRVQLYIPDDLDQRFTRFSNHEILKNEFNRVTLANLRSTTQPETRRIIDLIDNHNAVLEHEALLLPVS